MSSICFGIEKRVPQSSRYRKKSSAEFELSCLVARIAELGRTCEFADRRSPNSAEHASSLKEKMRKSRELERTHVFARRRFPSSDELTSSQRPRELRPAPLSLRSKTLHSSSSTALSVYMASGSYENSRKINNHLVISFPRCARQFVQNFLRKVTKINDVC